MNKFEIAVEIKNPFGNLYRKQTVLIAGADKHCNVVLSKKTYYPIGISRLPGGGVKKKESPIQAAKRETNEELNIKYPLNSFLPLAEFTIKASDHKKAKYVHSIFVYYLYINSTPLSAGGDVTSLKMTSLEGMRLLAKRYGKLSEELIYNHGHEDFLWRDYGRVYGPVHLEVAKLLALSKFTGCDKQL